MESYPLNHANGTINAISIDILFDPGSTNNFIAKYIIQKLALPTFKNANSWDLHLPDIQQHCNLVCKFTLIIGTYSEELTFDVANLPEHEIILS